MGNPQDPLSPFVAGAPLEEQLTASRLNGILAEIRRNRPLTGRGILLNASSAGTAISSLNPPFPTNVRRSSYEPFFKRVHEGGEWKLHIVVGRGFYKIIGNDYVSENETDLGLAVDGMSIYREFTFTTDGSTYGSWGSFLYGVPSYPVEGKKDVLVLADTWQDAAGTFYIFDRRTDLITRDFWDCSGVELDS